MSVINDPGYLRALAAQKGFTVERGLSKERWRLRDPKGQAIVGPRGTPSFRITEAVKFLRKQPDED
jgi:hypothetical protein